ncbi:uncharacterized protein EV154DRAFT_498675 [Mucor mucedo]|uniref:uncharacterized protein n=1 Tax=Mucor mucedo TaxID=29922 RepID=UPI00221E9DC2|nr:uncharacterized protein EV154DRAFT_498675 [Mucor mucedo]KAI7894416.1 hypothetical protein EV154DRAFT_498675 [Mucor mucedo]
MTHLSDFSYLERCTVWLYMTVYFVYSVYKGDRFKCLRPSSIISGELKSIITILLILAMVMQAMWDVMSTYVKYEEGFTVYEGKIIGKPFAMWSSTNQSNMVVMDYVECVTFSLQVGVFFLMQSFWNYLSNSVARKSFMSSFEFKFYIFWALGSMAMFPVLQWVYRNDLSKREVIPQLAYGIEALCTSLLGIRSHFRFKRIIALSQRNNGASNKTIVTRLAYFKDMNALVSLVLFFYAASFIILCADGLTTTKIINQNKFATDTIIANANICVILLWLLLISIFHPRPQYTRSASETTSTNNESTNTNNYAFSNNTPATRVLPTDRSHNYVINESVRGLSETTNKFGGGISTTKNANGGFMRPMSPITVDYPQSLTHDTVPLTSPAGRPFSPIESPQLRNMAVEDPYSSQPVMFSMMEGKKSSSSQRYNEPSSPGSMGRHDIPMRGMNSSIDSRNNTMSPPQRRFMEEDEYMDTYTEHTQTTAPSRIRRPSWERRDEPTQPITVSQPGGDQIVRDWLWQSPDRRNT